MHAVRCCPALLQPRKRGLHEPGACMQYGAAQPRKRGLHEPGACMQYGAAPPCLCNLAKGGRICQEHACSADVPRLHKPAKGFTYLLRCGGSLWASGAPCLCCLNDSTQPASGCLAVSLFGVLACVLHFSSLPFQTSTSQQCPPGHPPANRHARNSVCLRLAHCAF